MLALTGLFWSFSWIYNCVYYTLTQDSSTKNSVRQFFRQQKQASQKSFPARPSISLNTIFAQAQKDLPSNHQQTHTFIRLPTKKTNYFMILKQNQGIGSRERSYAFYHSQSGKLIQSFLSQNYNLAESFDVNYNYQIHTGRILGLPGQILALLASLIGTALPITGFIIWIRRIRKK